jgi:hypothetical protein
MRESQHLVFGLRLVRRIFEGTLTPCNPNQKSATFWGIFCYQMKVRQPIGRKDSIQTVIGTSALQSLLLADFFSFPVIFKVGKIV